MKLASTKIKEADLQEFWSMYESDQVTDDQFRNHARNLIQNARAPNPEILRKIDVSSRKRVLTMVNNFVMNGHGFGVI